VFAITHSSLSDLCEQEHPAQGVGEFVSPALVGESVVGAFVGAVGYRVGYLVGDLVGLTVGETVGDLVGALVGTVGLTVGDFVGDTVGDAVGALVCASNVSVRVNSSKIRIVRVSASATKLIISLYFSA
jgi:hypothetical protein